MPPSSSNVALTLHLRPQFFHLLQLEPAQPLPQSVLDALAQPATDTRTFLSVTRTKDEVSIISDHEIVVEGGRKQDGKLWRCFQVQGPMDLGLVGVLHDLTAPLKAAGIPIFSLSTWNTDWVLVPYDKAMIAVNAFHDDGWVVQA